MDITDNNIRKTVEILSINRYNETVVKRGDCMKRNVIMFTSMLLMISMLGGCGLFPFKEDLPSGTFGTETENTEANGEKLPTEQMNE